MRYLCESLTGRDGRLIEIGSSAGKHLRSLLALGYQFELHGNDVDLESLKLGHVTTPPVRFVLADGHHLPYRDQSFDVVIVMDYLEHVPDPKLANNEAMRILKKNAAMYIFVPCEGTPLSGYAIFKRIFGFNVKQPTGGHVQTFTHSTVLSLLQNGSHVETIYYSYHLLGALFDFCLFVLMYLYSPVARLYWQHNKFYHGNQVNRSTLISAFNATISCLNRLAYAESSFLKSRNLGACGLHIVLAKTSENK